MLAPGAVILVVADQDAFALRHGSDLSVQAAFSGQLSNGGELFKLSFGAGTDVIEFSYDDEDGWPIESDRDGFSLVRMADM